MGNTIITSDKKMINASDKEVFDYLCDFNNIKDLLPEDKISDWTATPDQCSFKVQNAATIPLVKESTEPNSRIHIVSGEKTPFPFKLVVHLDNKGGQTEGYLVFDGEISAFLKLMIEKPLANLFNYMAHKLEEKFSNS